MTPALPTDLEAESIALGAAMIDEDARAKALEELHGDDFTRPGHRVIFDGLRELARRNAPPDLAALVGLLEGTGKLDLIGRNGDGRAYVLALAEGVPSISNAPYYIARVKEQSAERRALSIVQGLAQRATAGTVEPEALRRDLARASAMLPDGAASAKSLEAGPVLSCLSDVKAELVQWLWPGRIALGKLTLIVGDPDQGKSLITLDLAARVSRGAGWPDCPADTAAPGGVVLLSAEDDLADTIRPRLDAAEADVQRVHALTTTKRFDLAAGKEIREPFNIAQHLQALEKAIKEVDDCRLVIIDPISSYLGGTDSHKNAEVRGLLSPLCELAARHHVAIVVVSHLRKGEGPAMYRAMGSLAFVAAARAAYVAGLDRDDPTGQRHFLLPIKSNLTKDKSGLAYRLDSTFSANKQPVVAWEPTPVAIRADEALNHNPGRDNDSLSERDEAADWLSDALRDGPRPAKEVIDLARQDGIAKRTLDRAKRALNVTAYKGKGDLQGSWFWRLGEDCHEDCQDTPVGNLGNLGNLRGNPNEHT